MFIKKKTLDKLISEAKNEVWAEHYKERRFEDIWNQLNRNGDAIYKLKKRVEALEEAVNKGGKK